MTIDEIMARLTPQEQQHTSSENVAAVLRVLAASPASIADTAGAALYHPSLGGVANSVNAANVAAGIADTAGAKLEPDELRKLIMTLRERADSDEMAASEIDPLHYTPDEPESLAMGLEFLARERRECADVLEQQAAVIAEQGRKIADYIVELEARAALAAPPAPSVADTAGAKQDEQEMTALNVAIMVLKKEGILQNAYALENLRNRITAPPASSVADAAGAEKDAKRWRYAYKHLIIGTQDTRNGFEEIDIEAIDAAIEKGFR